MDGKFVSVAGRMCFPIKSVTPELVLWRKRAMQHILSVIDGENGWMQQSHIETAYAIGGVLWEYLRPSEALQLVKVGSCLGYCYCSLYSMR